jgi:hypothetical protein
MDAIEGRWQVEQVFAIAPRPHALVAAESMAVPDRWSGTGCDDQRVWGRCIGTGSEPYECVVHHAAVATWCACPSRVRPCKHALGLLLMWARGQVAEGELPRFAEGRVADPVPVANPTPAPVASQPSSAAPPPPAPPERDLTGSRDERIARMAAGLTELDRWLDDRVRTGLADPALGQYRTWDQLAARLVDAQVGALANRVRRLAGVVGSGPDWHQQVLAEMGLLHLLAQGGRRLPELAPGLADSVAAAIGWQLRQAEVLQGVPHTDHWMVMGRSDVREDRIEVRRVWLRGRESKRWAMVLSFAAYQQSLDTSLEVGTEVHADLFRYPGAVGLRSIIGRPHEEPVAAPEVEALSVTEACAQIGNLLCLEPWLERVPACLLAAPARHEGRWVLTDAEGSLPVAADASGIGQLLACSGGGIVPITAEWTPSGLVPLTVHLPDRAVDIGPVADSSFVKREAS